MQLTVNSTRNSVVYLLTIDEGSHQSQPGFDFNIDNVSSSILFDYDIIIAIFDFPINE